MSEVIGIIETNKGTIELKFFPEKAPNHVDNFKKLAGEGFYDGTLFHRVIPGFMIQGGDFNTRVNFDDDRSWGQGNIGYFIDCEKSQSEVIDIRVKDNDKVNIENIELITMYTPGHTDCSYSFLMNDRIFTGDTLLINGTGRTDFQNGSARDQYDSLFNKILKLPEKTFVYPAHDYNGKKFSTIKNEKDTNPRLQVKSVDEYVEIMNSLKLSNPKMMDIAVSANKKGLGLQEYTNSSKIS